MKRIIFDLDGTLTDSGEGIMHCAELTLQHFSLPVPPRSEMRFMVGPPLRNSFLRFGIPESQLEEAVSYYRQHYTAVGQYENAPYSDIESLLDQLKSAGHSLYIATSKPEYMAENILNHFDLAQYFTVICGAVAGGRSTKETVLEHLLTQMPDRDTAVMVGDTIYDVLGAKFHGLPCIGVSWGYGNRNEMEQAGAVIADSVKDLWELLQ